MRTLMILAVMFAVTCLDAQQLNDKGLYISSDGELFTGKVTALKDNVKSELSVKDGVIEGEATYFYASGNIMEKGTFSQGKKDGKWIRLNENGSTSAIAFYSLGKKTGTWLVYDNQGHKRFEMNYQDGEKSGTWTSWDENGTVVSTKNYGIAN